MLRIQGALLLVSIFVIEHIVRDRDTAQQTSARVQAMSYRRSRALDLTGGNPRDSIVLSAVGKRADSLAITMTFYVNGLVAHQQRWTSDDELNDVDAIRNSPTKLTAFMTKRLDDVVRGVKREPINAEQVEHMGDAAALRKMSPRPTHQIVLSFGFENSIFMVWNAARKCMFVFMECC